MKRKDILLDSRLIPNDYKGLYHEFFVKRNSKAMRKSKRDLLLASSNVVKIHDDILQHFWIFFKWIPTRNVSKSKESGYKGLCWYGETRFTVEGARKLKNILMTILTLLSFAPRRFQISSKTWQYVEKLIGNFELLDPEKSVHKKQFVTLKSSVDKINELIVLIEMVLKSKNSLSLFHRGI